MRDDGGFQMADEPDFAIIRRRAIIIAAFLVAVIVLIIAIGPGQSDTPAAPASPSPAGRPSAAPVAPNQPAAMGVTAWSHALSQRSPPERARILAQGMSTEGFVCTTSGRTMFLGSTDKEDFWSVDCAEGDQLAMIRGDEIKGMDCNAGGALGIDNPCWKPMRN